VVVVGRRLLKTGEPVDAAPFQVAAPRGGGDQRQPRVAGSATDFMIVWHEQDAAGAEREIRGRLLGAADVP
jgi:hypothetical protein